MVRISELYGKKIISTSGKHIGEVKGVMLNFEEGTVSHLFLNDVDNIIRSPNLKIDFAKNSVSYKRVKKVSETIIVGEERL